MSDTHTVDQHFATCEPSITQTYHQLLTATRAFGEVAEDPKKTSIHLIRKTAFAGVAVRKSAIILTIKSTHSSDSPRIFKQEQTSASRWHLEVKLTSPDDVDAELIGWLQAAWEISG